MTNLLTTHFDKSKLWSKQQFWTERLEKFNGVFANPTLAILTEDDLTAMAIMLAANTLAIRPHCVSVRFNRNVVTEHLTRVSPDVICGDNHWRDFVANSTSVFISIEESSDDPRPLHLGSLKKSVANLSFSLSEPLPDGSCSAWLVNANDLESSADKIRMFREPKPGQWLVMSQKGLFLQRLITYYQAIRNEFEIIRFSGSAEDCLDLLHRKTHAMRFGIFFFGSFNPNDKSIYDTLLEVSRCADVLGFDSVWTPERHFNPFGGLFPNPALMSAALAMVTNSIQIRSGSLVAPLHDSLRIAENYAVVDNLSQGRLAVSFASGWQCDDFVLAPDRYETRDDTMFEQISDVRKLWSGGTLSRINGIKKLVDVNIYPKPLQSNLPIWITVSGKLDTFTKAGKYGAHILTHLLWQNKEELIEKIQAFRNSLRENGFDPKAYKVTVMVHTFLASDLDEATHVIRDHLKNYIKSSIFLIEKMVSSTKDSSEKYKEVVGRYGTLVEEIPEELMDELLEIAVDRFIKEAGLFGSVEDALSMIRTLKSYDVDEVACLVDFGPTKEEILSSMTLLSDLRNRCDDLLPNLDHQACLQMGLEEMRAVLNSPLRNQLNTIFPNRIVTTENYAGTETPEIGCAVINADLRSGLTALDCLTEKDLLTKMMSADLRNEI